MERRVSVIHKHVTNLLDTKAALAAPYEWFVDNSSNTAYYVSKDGDFTVIGNTNSSGETDGVKWSVVDVREERSRNVDLIIDGQTVTLHLIHILLGSTSIQRIQFHDEDMVGKNVLPVILFSYGSVPNPYWMDFLGTMGTKTINQALTEATFFGIEIPEDAYIETTVEVEADTKKAHVISFPLEECTFLNKSLSLTEYSESLTIVNNIDGTRSLVLYGNDLTSETDDSAIFTRLVFTSMVDGYSNYNAKSINHSVSVVHKTTAHHA